DNAPRRVDGMNLKNALGQIKAHGGNLHGGWLLCSGCLTANPLWHSEAGSGSHPPHLLLSNRSQRRCGRHEARRGYLPSERPRSHLGHGLPFNFFEGMAEKGPFPFVFSGYQALD
ncbi:hypothetical protein, partial [Mesorhizobium sp. M0244]|uniref:hypothetical protein n=1 Tax=Mesorhizobium sp. M0244 TaxID=2956926 RepID=UPI00333AF2EF